MLLYVRCGKDKTVSHLPHKQEYLVDSSATSASNLITKGYYYVPLVILAKSSASNKL